MCINKFKESIDSFRKIYYLRVYTLYEYSNLSKLVQIKFKIDLLIWLVSL